MVIFYFVPSAVLAAKNLQDAFNPNSGNPLGDASFKAGYEPIGAQNSVEATIGKVIQVFLSVIGIIFLILMVFAGYKWMTAHGEESKVTEAKDTIRTSIIGLIIVIGAYALSYFIIKSLGAGTLQGITT